MVGPLRGRLSAERSSFKDANPRTAPHSRSGQKKRPRIGGLSGDVLVRKWSRPPFTPEPQKRDGQILVANRIAGEAVVRIVPSNSFNRCNYATSASDRRVHEIFNWCPEAIVVLLTRLGLAGWQSPPDTPAALSSSPRLTAHRWSRFGPARAWINPLDSRRHHAASQSRSIEVRRPALSCSAAAGEGRMDRVYSGHGLVRPNG